MARRPKSVADVAAEYFAQTYPGATGPSRDEPATPLMAADDLCWNCTADGGRRKDLLEWLDEAFDPSAPGDRRDWLKAYATLADVVSERFGRRVVALWTFLEYARKNRFPPLAWQASCWNEMLHRLGHKVPKAARADPGLPAEGT